MLSKKQTAAVVWFLMFLALLIFSAFSASNGSIVILGNPNGKSFTMNFTQFNSKNKCELSLLGGDVLQVEVTRDSGKIALTVSGKNGDEPYTGNDLESGIFTIAVSETDEYVFQITCKDATGKITVKNLGRNIFKE